MPPAPSITHVFPSPEAAALLRTLLYFDVFRYPMRAAELQELSQVGPGTDAAQVLREMVHAGWVQEKQGFYYVSEAAGDVERRKRGNALAQEKMQRARDRARRIARFPYVTAVMVSGSLSKGYMDPGSDIDFFILTQPGRLWIARTLLVLYKRLVLLGSHKEFCVNYFLDTDHLVIEDHNAFTALETVTLLPMVNAGLYHSFRTANAWSESFFPNTPPRDTRSCPMPRRSLLSRAAEWFWKGRLGDALDAWCMRRTMRRWQHKFPHFDADRMDLAMRSRTYVSKHHPSNFQEKVLTAWAQKIQDFETLHGIPLSASPRPESHG